MENSKLLTTIVLSLLSGIAGSVIGAIIGSIATLKAAKISLDGLYKQGKEERRIESKKKNLIVIHSLIKELKENQSISKDLPNNPFKHIVMSREAWSIYKGNISFMTEKLQINLPLTYALIAEYNSILEYDRAYLSHGEGYNNEKIAKRAEKFRDNVDKVINELEKMRLQIEKK
ncbi:hypothetical protein HYW87_00500 [Candidatus Roizmanbacteria bacterium]|nr:hypothetical protein [Candidatus Roizmanbacteria bacterium]